LGDILAVRSSTESIPRAALAWVALDIYPYPVVKAIGNGPDKGIDLNLWTSGAARKHVNISRNSGSLGILEVEYSLGIHHPERLEGSNNR
jgi:hypothetical protein